MALYHLFLALFMTSTVTGDLDCDCSTDRALEVIHQQYGQEVEIPHLYQDNLNTTFFTLGQSETQLKLQYEVIFVNIYVKKMLNVW